MPFDLNGATKAGYSNSEIAGYLAQQNPDFDYSGAKKAGYGDDEIATHLSSLPSSLHATSGIGNDLKGDAADEAAVLGRNATGEENIGSTALQTMGNVVNPVWQAAGEAIKGIPGYNAAKGAVNAAGEATGDWLMNRGAAPAFDAAGNPIRQAAGEFAQNHPEAMRDLMAMGKILPLESAIGTAGNILGAAGENAAQTPVDMAAKKAAAIRPYADVEKANNALGDITSAHYDKAESLGANINLEASPIAAQAIRKYTEVAANNGLPLDPDLHKQTNAALNNLDKKADSGLTITSIENTRKKLGKIMTGNPLRSTYAEDGFAAGRAIKAIDSLYDTMQNQPAMLESGTPDAIDALGGGRAAHALESNHDTLTEMMRQANGNPNALQSKFKSLFDDADELKRFSPDQQKTIGILAHPTAINKILAGVGKMGFGSDRPYIPATELASVIPTSLMNPLAGAAIAGAVTTATAANVIRTKMVRGMVDNLLRDIESKSVSVDKTLGNSGFSPLPEQGMLPAPSTPLALPAPNILKSDWSGNVSPMTQEDMARAQASREAWPSVTPGEAQPVAAHGDAREPMPGNAVNIRGNPVKLQDPFIKDDEASSYNTKLSPRAQRIAAQSQAMSSAVNSPAGRILQDLAAGKPTAPAPIKSMQDIAPSILSDSLVREQERQRIEEEQMMMQMQGARGHKRGGAIPSRAQIEAGNYKKDHLKIQGLDISIETPKGEIRRGKGWENISPAHYGYIRGTVGGDSEHVDCYVGSHPKSNRIYVIDQHHLHNGAYDEAKVMIGFESRDEAIACYKTGFSDGKGKQRIGKVTRMSMAEFKDWLKNGNTKKPVKEAA